MEKYIGYIKNVNLFSTLEESDIKMISKITYVKAFDKGYVVFQEGDKGDALYVILNGKVKISLFDENGREYILDVIGKDGFFGELSLIDELPRSANVVTTEDAEFLIVRRHDFTKLLIENPKITINILKTLSGRLRAADERIRGLAFLSVEGRILKYLTDIGEESGTRVRDYIIIENGPSQVELASFCGCSRETVSRTITNLVKKGVISVRKRQYTLRPVYPSF